MRGVGIAAPPPSILDRAECLEDTNTRTTLGISSCCGCVYHAGHANNHALGRMAWLALEFR